MTLFQAYMSIKEKVKSIYKAEEVNVAFGCMVKPDMYFIVSGELNMES